MRYEKTDNPNVILHTWEISEEIHIDKLKAKVAKLEHSLEAITPRREYPKDASDETKEVYDFFNDFGGGQVDEGSLIDKRDELQVLIDKCEGL